GYSATGEIAAVAIDAAGANLYAVDRDTGTLHVTSRDAVTGELAAAQVLTDGAGGVDGLARAAHVVLGPDGGAVYVARAGDAAVAVFDRDATDGTLTFVEADTDAASGASELVDPGRPVVAPDGLHVYVPGSTPLGTAFARLTVFSRSPLDGSLTGG